MRVDQVGVQVDAQNIEAGFCQASGKAQSELSEPDDGEGFGTGHGCAGCPYPAPLETLDGSARPFATSSKIHA